MRTMHIEGIVPGPLCGSGCFVAGICVEAEAQHPGHIHSGAQAFACSAIL
ncbi:MAG: hypothetical protein K0S39_4163 [Paenibacillus sp.]|jgi:hypothetical protein|nr:hypothetical protein [Paenibacillus sp.]